MSCDPELVCRVALGLMAAGALGIALPPRWRAERAGGAVARNADPKWFWFLMSVVGPPVPLVVAVFLWDPRWVDFSTVCVPWEVRLAGVPLGLIGLAWFAWVFHHLGFNVTSTSEPRANATLVTRGPYRWVRHPMYTAVFVLALAAVLLTANAIVAVGGGVGFVLLAARSAREEARLIEKFAGAYRDYQRRTGRFWPRLRRPRE